MPGCMHECLSMLQIQICIVWTCRNIVQVAFFFYFLPFEVLCLLTVGKKKSLWGKWIQNSCQTDLIVMTARNHLGLLLRSIPLVETSLLSCWIWHMYVFYVTAGMCSKCLFVIESVPFTQRYVNSHLRPIINI